VSTEGNKTKQDRKSLTDAGLVEINLDQFPDRIKEVTHVAMGRLSELLERKNDVAERESVARSLGTLKQLKTKVGAAHSRGERGRAKQSEG
jgi:hypothetical protein